MLRLLCSLTRLYWLSNERATSNVVFAAEIDGVAAPEAWRAAFDGLQCRHPLLRARIPVTPPGFPYLASVHYQPIPLCHACDAVWTPEGISSEWLDVAIARAMAEPHMSEVAPMMRAVIVSDVGRSVLILTCKEEVSNGIDILYCIRDLLQALNGEAIEELALPLSRGERFGEAKVLIHPEETLLKMNRESVTVRRLGLSRVLTGPFVQRP
jgi:hypothetical protein